MFTADQLKRYSRQYIIREIGAEGQKKIMAARVLVIGAGALGSPAIMYLASAGVGHLGIADFDTVDLSNLQRQIIHSTGRIGTMKTRSARQIVNDLNPDVECILHEEAVHPGNIADIIRDYDFIVDCTDRLEMKLLINDACVIMGKPYVHAGIERFYGEITTYVPGGPCLRCLYGDVSGEGEENACARYGVMGAVPGIVGSMQALEAIKYITGTGELLVGRMINIDGFYMEFEPVEFEKDPDCRICGQELGEDYLKSHREDYEVRCSI